ncbi:phosphate-starvation-inducible PsiE family protein [Halorientalis marina]|uniref:phosphate-starvation-inducible PsiE family protein n=1 Tax=Halorientalis marina TaxID=2931976 RepID=UPI001FF0F78B|nr:phosphate-starvation-inducible PsiE family protein [Halorientalis marina]
MAEDHPDGDAETATASGEADEPTSTALPGTRIDPFVDFSERVMQLVELVAGFVLVVLFAIGVFDLGLQIVNEIRSGDISDPLVVIGFIDTALLLFIIVEVYNTVIAYARSDETARILRLVIFTGVIALVRKAIVFRTGEFATKTDALMVAASYALLTLTLGVLLFVSYQFVGGEGDEPAQY